MTLSNGQIVRKSYEKPFSIIYNSLSQDDRLSFGARGLMLYMLSLPQDWIYHKNEVIQHDPKMKPYTFDKLWKELQTFGYISKQYIQNEETGKMAGTCWLIDEFPENSRVLTDPPEKSIVGENPTVEPFQPSTPKNRQSVNIERSVSHELQNIHSLQNKHNDDDENKNKASQEKLSQKEKSKPIPRDVSFVSQKLEDMLPENAGDILKMLREQHLFGTDEDYATIGLALAEAEKKLALIKETEPYHLYELYNAAVSVTENYYTGNGGTHGFANYLATGIQNQAKARVQSHSAAVNLPELPFFYIPIDGPWNADQVAV